MRLLPAELIDLIFSFLRDDISALRACSKSHPLYSRLAERHLYIDIDIWLYEPSTITELHNQLSNNSRILRYPRTLKIVGDVPLHIYPPTLPIISMIPRMINLVSLHLHGLPCSSDQYEEFISILRDSLQQSSLEKLTLGYLEFPLSILDTSKNIKHLTLDFFTPRGNEPVSESTTVQSLETLIIEGSYNPDILFWATHRVTCLISLELRDLIMDQDWTAFPELLAACSNSLTSLHLNIGAHCQSTYSYHIDNHVGQWFDDDEDFPFTLSAHIWLKKLSIFTYIYSYSEDAIEIHSSLPAIIRLIQTAPSIQHIILSAYYKVSDITFIGQLDWSPLSVYLQSGFSGIRHPRIDLYVSGEGLGYSISDESLLDALAENEVLMDLVNRDVVTLKSGKTDRVI